MNWLRSLNTLSRVVLALGVMAFLLAVVFVPWVDCDYAAWWHRPHDAWWHHPPAPLHGLLGGTHPERERESCALHPPPAVPLLVHVAY